MTKAYKGSDFEREICKLLSRWWTNGERDDVFWRSSQSGGRATQRAKDGKATFGSYGDLTAVDPIGAPLLKVFTIELKRGSSHGSPGDLFDALETDVQRPWEAAICQAIRSHWDADSQSWMLICRRDRRQAVVYLDLAFSKPLLAAFPSRRAAYSMPINLGGGKVEKMRFVGLLLSSFLLHIKPKQIIQLAGT